MQGLESWNQFLKISSYLKPCSTSFPGAKSASLSTLNCLQGMLKVSSWRGTGISLLRGRWHMSLGKCQFVVDTWYWKFSLELFILFLLSLSLFFFSFFPCRSAWGILVPQPGIKPRPQQWKCQGLTTGPPGKSKSWSFLHYTPPFSPAGQEPCHHHFLFFLHHPFSFHYWIICIPIPISQFFSIKEELSMPPSSLVTTLSLPLNRVKTGKTPKRSCLCSPSPFSLLLDGHLLFSHLP